MVRIEESRGSNYGKIKRRGGLRRKLRRYRVKGLRGWLRIYRGKGHRSGCRRTCRTVVNKVVENLESR